MDKASDNFCYSFAGFWVEIPDDGREAEIYLLPDFPDADRDGRPTEFPIKRLPGKRDDAGKFSQPATLLAARVWCFWAREEIKAERPLELLGDGTRPLGAAPAIGELADSFDEGFFSDALATATLAQTSDPEIDPPADPPAKTQRRRKGA